MEESHASRHRLYFLRRPADFFKRHSQFFGECRAEQEIFNVLNAWHVQFELLTFRIAAAVDLERNRISFGRNPSRVQVARVVYGMRGVIFRVADDFLYRRLFMELGGIGVIAVEYSQRALAERLEQFAAALAGD